MSTSSLLTFMALGTTFGLAFFLFGFIVRKRVAERKIRTAEKRSQQIVIEAEKEAKVTLRSKEQEAERYFSRLKKEYDDIQAVRVKELDARMREVRAKEEAVDNKTTVIHRRELEIGVLESNLVKEKEATESTRTDLKRLMQNEREVLQRISGLSGEEAKRQLLRSMEADVRTEASRMIKLVEKEAKEFSEKKAKKILSLAIQRCAAEHSIESTVSVVNLPSDEMKGRIIGKEGRNIRTFESVTGVDLVIDDTPGAVILSAFDAVRREIARIALERLIEDGRIHPSSIEEVVGQVRQEMDRTIREEGDRTIQETNVGEMHAELKYLLGRLRYRTSYGQNALIHSIEVANLMNVFAGEMGLDPIIARRAGLLHDIGKAVSHEVEGPHALIGGELARRYGEAPVIIHAIEAHHQDIEQKGYLPVLVQAADAVSGARPGARRESLENYIKRLRRLEQAAASIMGVDRVFAIQAGREIRVMVQPDQVSDQEMPALAREISKKVESDLQFPGQIRVTVIRETRATEFAK